jgi:hypothetical protein
VDVSSVAEIMVGIRADVVRVEDTVANTVRDQDPALLSESFPRQHFMYVPRLIACVLCSEEN